ncbi:MAG TPA: glutaredoxin family protein [Candidatus Thermoplasmatota archaeon]|nr:glutaredoxin family protein [Candidatus Thermoplasmatota archaeon]
MAAKWRVPERRFKAIAFVTTLAGVALIAGAINAFVFERDIALAIALFVFGVAAGSAHVFVEPVSQPKFSVTLYTREDCALCEEAEALLLGFSGRHGFDVWTEDVDADPALAERYGDRVPVAMVGERTLFELEADPARLEADLRRLARAP